jgi:lysozyme
MLQGCDISHWDDDLTTARKIDFEKMKNGGAHFVFFKATQAKFTDKVFQTSWADAKGVLPRGVYCYLDYAVSGLEQAKYFVDTVYGKGDDPELPPVCDFESRVNVPQNANAHLWNWLDYVQQHTGKIPMIYTSPSYWHDFGTPHPAWKKYGLWIANYMVQAPNVPLPWDSFTFWQYSDKGNGAQYGVESKAIDLDYFNGDETGLAVLCGTSIGVPPTTLEQKVEALYSQARAHGWILP